jgi:hypothetical protein
MSEGKDQQVGISADGNVEVGGDIAGRDIVKSTTTVIQRGQGILVVAVVAIVAIFGLVVLITRPTADSAGNPPEVDKPVVSPVTPSDMTNKLPNSPTIALPLKSGSYTANPLPSPRAPQSNPGTVVDYFVDKSSDQMYGSLYAKVNGQQYKIVGTQEQTCLTVEDQRDYDGNGSTDALIRRNVSCGGNCCADAFYFVSYMGNGHFEQSADFASSWVAPEVQEWKGMWSVVITSSNEGINTLAPVETRERYVLDTGQAVRVESSEHLEIVAVAELRSEQFDPQNDGQELQIPYDLDGDAVSDKITGKFWARWGRIIWSVELSKGGSHTADLACKRVGVLSSETNGVRDIVCDFDDVYRWDGHQYRSSARSQ